MKRLVSSKKGHDSARANEYRPLLSLVSKLKTNAGVRWFERILFIAGLLLISVFAVVRFGGIVAAHMGLVRFEASTKVAAQIRSANDDHLKTNPDVDFSLWSEKRIQAYRQSLATYAESPTAVLDVPKLRLRVPVFDGTDDLTLNRGVGRIIGTDKPGQGGNIGIAGHRDGFFRGLKDIVLGDAIELETRNARRTYIVDEIRIVTPDDVSVLRARAAPSVTLITCYPFYYIGPAPKRYIVFASLRDEEPQVVRRQFAVRKTTREKNSKEEPRYD